MPGTWQCSTLFGSLEKDILGPPGEVRYHCLSNKLLGNQTWHQKACARRSTPEPVRPTASEDVISNESNMVWSAALVDKEKGTVYTDATGTLPVLILEGNQYYVCACDHDNSYTHSILVIDVKDETTVKEVKGFLEEMESKGHTPMLNVTDNQTAKLLEEYLTTRECKWQFVEPHNHQVNTTERTIQIFKNHLISGFCCVVSECTLQLCDLTDQALVTLNLRRTSWKEPNKCTYCLFHGKIYDWNKYAMALPGTWAMVYIVSHIKASWSPMGWTHSTMNQVTITTATQNFMSLKLTPTKHQHLMIHSHSIICYQHSTQSNTQK